MVAAMQNLNSDKLRRQLDENNAAMNTLAEDNQRIVELLAQRGLQAVEKTAGEDLVCSADKMIIFNAAGAEVFNTDWPNPLIYPDQYEAHSRMAEWVSKFTKAREDRMPLTTEELNAGGWWCDDVSEECANAFKSKGLSVYKPSRWGQDEAWIFFKMNIDRNVVVINPSKDVAGGSKQIHRIGNHFYWGAAK